MIIAAVIWLLIGLAIFAWQTNWKELPGTLLMLLDPRHGKWLWLQALGSWALLIVAWPLMLYWIWKE